MQDMVELVLLFGFAGVSIVFTLVFTYWFNSRLSAGLYSLIDSVLASAGWERSLAIPETTLSSMRAFSFEADVAISGHTCIHRYSQSQSSLYFAYSSNADTRNTRRGLTTVSSADIRSPLHCFVTINPNEEELSRPGRYVVKLRKPSNNEHIVFVCFKKNPTDSDHLLSRTIRIVDLIFNHHCSSLAHARYAILALHGMIVCGPVVKPILLIQSRRIRVGMSQAHVFNDFVSNACKFLEHSSDVWRENQCSVTE